MRNIVERQMVTNPGEAAPPVMSAPRDDALATTVRRMTADRRRTLRRALAALTAAAVLGALWAQYRRPVRAFVNGEIDLEGRPQYEPPHRVDREVLAAIDFERVHERLLPAWTIALGHATTPVRRRYAERKFQALIDEVGADPNLAELLTDTHDALADGPIEHAHRVDYYLWAYNDYLEAQRVPWRVEASLALTEDRAIFRALSYEVLADRATADGHRLRLLRRADRTNALEGWLGRSGELTGALVLMRRVLHFAARHVWPGLHPGLDARRPANERSWLGYVRDEVRAQLDPETYALLRETASDQQALLEVQAAVAARHACGSRFRIRHLPYNGVSPRTRGRILRALDRSDPECPEITLSEAAQILSASERLSSTPGLADAVERLAMIVARAVAIHELRHVADGERIACPGCPDALVGLARAEVSAYLSAFSTEGLGYVALFQACATPRGRGLHGAALSAVLDALLPYGCEGPTLHGLYPLAERIERELFGERPAVTLPPLPARVALLPRTKIAAPPRVSARALESGWGMSLSH